VALVVGGERHRVGDGWRQDADQSVSIPMPTDSLNVAVAAGVVLFEAVRQRRCGARSRAVDEPAHTRDGLRLTENGL
jgi:RNA methyltransferase, TrmH family